ncbi:hypothetical protein KKB18_02145 [bacterium]|nr:hypothetical protein [bacterium]
MLKKRIKKYFLLLIILIYSSFNVGCFIFNSNLVNVAPYEKEYIADPIMAFDEEFSDEQTLMFTYFADFENTWYVGAGSAGGCST